MKEEYHKFNTLNLDRDFELQVFGHYGFPVILFPPEKGRFYDAKDFGLINSVSHFVDSGKIKIYCPDSIDWDSWFNYSIHPSDRVKTHNGYENVILYDIIEFAKYETGAERVALAGCGFGGYHALNTAFKHPDLVSHLITMNSYFDIKRFIWGYYDDNCYFNNPTDYLPGLNDDWYLSRIKNMQIILGTGEFDSNRHENEHLSYHLNEKGIDHLLDIRKCVVNGFHTWREMFPHYLSVLNL